MEILPIKIIRQILHIPALLPYCVQVEITNVCNLSCGMCPRHHVSVPREHMKLTVFRKIIDRLDGVGEVTLVGLGEPFVHPDIFEAINVNLDFPG